MNALAYFGSSMLQAAEDIARKAKMDTGRVTNPNAKKLGKGKNAKSKKRLAREAAMRQQQMQMQQQQMQMQQPQMTFDEQQQLQNDQFKFLQDNIFGRTGATRRTIGGQLERDVPQGMDFFKNTGPDRPEVAARQARLDSTGLNRPGVWNQAQQAVNDAKRAQGWSDPNTPPAPPPGPSMDQILRQNTNTVDVFNNPANNQTNPRTGLTTNDGPFVRSRPNPYGSARALFTPQIQGAGAQGQQSQASVNPGPVQQLFTPQPTMNRMDPPSAVFSPQSSNWQDMPSGPARSYASFGVNPEAPAQPAQPQGPPRAIPVNEMPSGPARSYAQFGLQDPQEPMFGNLFKDPTPQTSGALPDVMSFQNDYFGPEQGRQEPMKVPYPLDRFMVNPIDPVTQSMLPDLMNLPQMQLPNMPWQRDQVVDPNDRTKLITQPNWYDQTMSFIQGALQAPRPQNKVPQLGY